MKEQWRKHDSDAKLLLNVEEGTPQPQPIKIELPISAFQLKQDGCCNRLITFLRVSVLFVLLLILCWTAATLYSNYYSRPLVTDEKTEQLVGNQHDFNSEENKASFRNKVYRMFDETEIDTPSRPKVYHMIDETEIDSPSAPELVAASELPVDKGYALQDVRYIPPMIKMKNVGGIRIINYAQNQENRNENELRNMDSKSLESKLHDYIFKERLNLENFPEGQSVNEDDISVADQQTYVKLVNIPLEIPQEDYFAKRFNLEVQPEPKSDVSVVKVTLTSTPDKELASDKEDSMEGFKNVYKSAEEDDKNEIVTISNLEVENAQQSGEDLSKYMEPEEIDDIDQLISDIANLMGIYEEPSNEVNQQNEESAAVIQEEIKNYEEKLGIVDLENVSSVEEKSQEQSVAIVQEEIKDDNDNLLHFVRELEPSIEAEDPDVEAVAVVQEEIKSESDKFIDPAMPPQGMEYGNMFDNLYMHPWRPYEVDLLEKSQEKTSSEETSIDDLDRNISQNSPQLPLKSVTKRDYAVTLAKLLEPFVGNDYELAHWYYSTLLGPFSPDDDKQKMYAAKILYSEKISEFDSDVEMWLNEILENPYISIFSDIVNPQKQIEADTFLENQIADKILEKVQLKAQYDFNMMTSEQASMLISISNSNHLKSWFLATHPSVRDRDPIRSMVVMSMDARRKLYPMIKNDFRNVMTELNNEKKDLELLEFDINDFSVPPMISTFEILSFYHKTDFLQTLLQKENVLIHNENVSPVEERHFRRIQQVLIEAQKKKLEREGDYSEESDSNQQSIIEAMQQVAEEYEQTEKSSEETTTSLVEDHTEIEKSEEETDASIIKNDDEKNVGSTEEVSPDSNQFESSNTNLNPIEEVPLQTESDEQVNRAEEISPDSNQFESLNTNLNPIEEVPFQTESDEQVNGAEEISSNSNQFDSSNTNLNPIEELPFQTDSDEQVYEEEFLKWLQEQAINYKPVENEEEQFLYDPNDPFDY